MRLTEEHSLGGVTDRAEQTADLAGVVVVVDTWTPSPRQLVETGRALAALLYQKIVVLTRSQVVAPRPRVAARAQPAPNVLSGSGSVLYLSPS